ncbi:MAG: hypothetical protein L6Q76_01965 [Polyangiaceae bacterium]|nr:hypothetical protein [Polyangiaceae bacterium]
MRPTSGAGDRMKTKSEAPADVREKAADPAESARARDLLEQVNEPVRSADLTLTSGRRYEINAEGDRDKVTVRGRGGDIVLRIEVTDAGPVLSFSGASIDIAAAGKLRLKAEEVVVEAAGNIALAAGGSLRESVGGHHHTRVGGEERIEAAGVAMQANERSVEVRAMGKIALDGEHIGLNDDPLPQPFAWSALGEEGSGDDSKDPNKRI